MIPPRPPSKDHLGLIGRAVLYLVRNGEATIEEVEAEIAEDLAEGSAATRRRAVQWAAALYALDQEPLPDLGRPAPERERSVKGRAVHATPAAIEKSLVTLRALPWNRRRERVQRGHYALRGAAMARAFLAEARAALPGSPADSGRWAELAEIACGLDDCHFCASDAEQGALELRAALYKANAARCLGELAQAERALEGAVFEAQQLQITDPDFCAEAKSFRASVHRDRREFPAALREAHLAAALYAFGGNRAAEVRTRLKIGTIHEQLGEAERALLAFRDAVAVAAEISDRALRFAARHAEALALARTKRFPEARTVFLALTPEYPSYPSHQNLGCALEALIAAGLGETHAAEAAFRAARDGFLNQKNAYAAANVTLDWSLFLLDQDRPEEVLPLAVSMGQAFEALGVARETMASWAIFQAAAERRELNRTVAESLVRTLGEERAGAKPKR